MNNFNLSAFGQTDAGAVVEILDTPQLPDHNAGWLRKHHAVILLRNDQYRQILDNDGKLMWFHLDDLIAKSDTNVMEELRNDCYRRILTEDKAAIWYHLDKLVAKLDGGAVA